MKIISAQPATTYFLWQLKVQVHNFKKLGIDKDYLILIGYENKIPKGFLNFAFNTTAKVFFIKDNREDKTYSPSIVPFLIKKYIEKKGIYEPTFLLDSDVIFRKLPSFKRLEKTDNWYVSDTRSYNDSEYILSKGDGLLEEMAKIINIDPENIKKNDKNTGGSQYIIKQNKYEFWDKVEKDCVALYKKLEEVKYNYNSTSPIQSWTSFMWSILWNAWLFGYETRISKDLNFAWATDKIKNWDKNNILHMAGVTSDLKHLFNKLDYVNKEPFNDEFSHVSKSYCCYKYVEEIEDYKKTIYNK
ncbi:MAG: hypothetical protein ACOC33_00320 [bacterium]